MEQSCVGGAAITQLKNCGFFDFHPNKEDVLYMRDRDETFSSASELERGVVDDPGS